MPRLSGYSVRLMEVCQQIRNKGRRNVKFYEGEIKSEKIIVMRAVSAECRK